MTAADIWKAYESCMNSSDAKIPLFSDLVRFIQDEELIVPVAYFLKRIFDHWGSIDVESSTWFLMQLSKPSEYSGFLLNLLMDSLKTETDVKSWTSNPASLLLTYLMTEYHKVAEEVLYKICIHDANYLISEEALNFLIQLMNQNSTYKIRCFDLVIKVSCIDDSHLSKILDSSLVKSLINDFKSNDILVVLNVIELTTELVQRENGIRFLERTDITVELDAIFHSSFDSIDDYLKVCAAIKFWARFVLLDSADLKPILTSFRVLDRLDSLLGVTCTGRDELVVHSMTVLGNLGSHKTGLEMILNHSSILERFSLLYKGATNQMKSYCIQTLSDMLDRNMPLNSADSEMCKTVYDLFPTCLNDINQYWKNPFDDVRFSVYALLKGIVSHPWGIQIVANHVILFLLLDRSTESNLIGKKWRLGIVETILAHDCTKDLMISSNFQKLEDYVKNGLNYSSVGPIVSMESA